MCRLDSNPRPVLEPVTMYVWPSRLVLGMGSETNKLDRTVVRAPWAADPADILCILLFIVELVSLLHVDV